MSKLQQAHENIRLALRSLKSMEFDQAPSVAGKMKWICRADALRSYSDALVHLERGLKESEEI